MEWNSSSILFHRIVIMLKIETIEELESKVVKALELIQDLRTENARLERRKTSPFARKTTK
ncbi:Hypothetical protein LEPBI_I2397 [Leptospira biflexa serovar Patoc strain 'Patoc 1 (Paris)']|uniref:Uncharacterized protein n=1 Tax=Leptospira biflexa serovar Patoc (strain Patoc 1 / ATCC 23582 / Paris) TaxID=456481 RepID=B0SKZ4_LEPBP|nr:Hypothetical protein LEPBI_I2397 [Leptospira biflexa serovar Patoc strain 'Patoc 1 (Paris)']